MKLKMELKTNKAKKLKTLKKKTHFGKTKLLGIFVTILMITTAFTGVATIQLTQNVKASNSNLDETLPVNSGATVILGTVYSYNYGNGNGVVYVTDNAVGEIIVPASGGQVDVGITYNLNAPGLCDWTRGEGTVNGIANCRETYGCVSGTWGWSMYCHPGDTIHWTSFVRLTDWWLTGSMDISNDCSGTVNIITENNPPTCSLSADPSSGSAPLTTTFSMGVSDSDGTISSWKLDINNDGNAEYSGSGNPPTSKIYTYNNPGEYTAKLTVWDNDGATGTDTTTVSVSSVPNDPPYTPPTPSGPSSREVGQSGSYSTSTTDPNGDSVEYKFDWGDGTSSWGSGTRLHSWSSPGTYHVKAKARDIPHHAESEWSSGKTVTVILPNTPPKARFSWSLSEPVPTDTSIHFDASASSDSDGNIVSYEWNFGDGCTDTGVNPTHSYSGEAVYSVTLTVTDDDGDTDTKTKQIDVFDNVFDVSWNPLFNGKIDIHSPYNFQLHVTNRGHLSYSFLFGLELSKITFFLHNGNEIQPESYVKPKAVCKFDGDSYTLFNEGDMVSKERNLSPGNHNFDFEITSQWHWIPEWNLGSFLQLIGDSSGISSFLDTYLMQYNSPYSAIYSYEGIGDSDTGDIFDVTVNVTDYKFDSLESAAHGAFGSVGFAAITAIAAVFGGLPGVITGIISGTFVVATALSYQAADDPNNDYTEIVNPNAPYYPDGLNNLTQPYYNLGVIDLQMIPIMKAEVESYIRYLGAIENDSNFYATQQLAAAMTYNNIVANLSMQLHSIYEPIYNDIIQNLPTDSENISSYKDYLTDNGLPPIQVELLDFYGFNQSEANKIVDVLLLANDSWYKNITTFTNIFKNFSKITASIFDNTTSPIQCLLAEVESSHKVINTLSPPSTVTYYVEFENISDLTGYSIDTAVLNNNINAISIASISGDYDNDGIDDFAIDFNGNDVISTFQELGGIQMLFVSGNVTTPSGTVYYSGGTLTEVNPPVADANGPYKVNEGDSVDFDGTGCHDPDDNIEFYHWDFDDDNVSNTQNPLHLYDLWGDYTVNLTVRDEYGISDTDTTTVSVNAYPISDANGPYDGSPDEPIPLDGSGSSDIDGTIDSYDWDLDNDGQYDDITGMNPSPSWSESGLHYISLRVTDNDGATDTNDTTVYINAPPEINNPSPFNGATGQSVEYLTWSIQITDVEGDHFDWSIECSNGQTLSDTNDTNGTKEIPIGGLEYNTQYIIWVNATDPDGSGKTTEEQFVFTTADGPPTIVYIDDDFNHSTSGFGIDHFIRIQHGVNHVAIGGTVNVYDGFYSEPLGIISIDKEGILIHGIGSPAFGISGAYIEDNVQITANDITFTNFILQPSEGAPSLIVKDGVNADTIEIHNNKFEREYESDAIGIENEDQYGILDARYNWWGAPNGPSGLVPDAITGRKADGYGVAIVDNGPISFEPWAGVHAEMIVSQTAATPGTAIIFDGKDSFAYHLDGTPNTIDEYFWDFGDGFYSMNEQQGHVYHTPGVYDVTLRIRADDLQLYSGFMYGWNNVTINIFDEGTPLTANADAENFGRYESIRNTIIQLYGSGIGGTPPYTFEWKFGDGSWPVEEQNPTHTYDEAGTYTVTLTVTDSVGDVAMDTAEVTVNEPEPLIATAEGSIDSVEVDESISFTGSASGGLIPYEFMWNFGDGSPTVERRNAIHSYELEGTYTVTLTVTDHEGTTATDTIEVTVAKQEEEPIIGEIQGGFGIKTTITAGSEPVDWTINIEGRLVFGDTDNSGSIAAYATETVKSSLAFGLGRIDITITANELTEKRNAFMLGPFILSVEEI